MDSQEITRSNMETTTIQWVLCSPHFGDMVIIAPNDLHNIPTAAQYDEILGKQMCKRYFKVEHCKTQWTKGRRPKGHVVSLKRLIIVSADVVP